jgi:superoxide dismutase, Fe-Mn family
MAFTLPALPYALDALEPHIDATTMGIHHSKHHQAYVTNLNAALDKAPDVPTDSLENILGSLHLVPDAVRNPIRNNGGGHWNHSHFWESMAPNAGGEPTGDMATVINARWGSYSAFRDTFKAQGVGRFGSGWVWLMHDGGEVAVTSTPNQDNPIMDGRHSRDILLGCDVWEHAYYLKYQNRRPDYLDSWFNTINWAKISARLSRAMKNE